MSSKKQDYYVTKFNLCDRNHFWILKGIAILMALIATFCQIFFNVGYTAPIIHIAVAIFALCSGFGISESFLKKKGLVHYWENKLIKIWIPSVVVVVILNVINEGNVASWISRTPLGMKSPVLYLIFGGYAAFWLAFRAIEDKSARILALFGCALVGFVLLPETSGIKPHLFAIPVGVLLSQTGWKRAMMKAGWGVKILVLAGCLILAAVGGILASILRIPYLSTAIQSVFYLASAMSVLLITYYLQKIQIWGAFVPFGWISYAVYLIQDGVFKMFNGKSDPKMYAAMFAVIFAVSALITWLREVLISWNYKMRRKGRAHLKGSMN